LPQLSHSQINSQLHQLNSLEKSMKNTAMPVLL
jgi:hypothetical protein